MDAAAEPVRLKVDDLAREAGTTTRNVRAYQQRGLLPPPELVGRTGFYGRTHLDRLRLIGELQGRGFSLAAIESVVETLSRGGDLSTLLGLEHVLSAPWTDEETESTTLEALLERFPDAREDPSVLDDVQAQGLVVIADDGAVTIASPLLLAAGAELTRLGVPSRALLEVTEAVRTDMADVADRFLGLVRTQLVDDLARAEDPDPERLAEVARALQRLRAVALEVVRPFLAQELGRAVGEALEDYGELLTSVVEPGLRRRAERSGP